MSREKTEAHSQVKKGKNLFKSSEITDFYIIEDTIGEGTFGKVKSATHKLTGEKVAIKFLEKSKIKDKESYDRVAREISFLKRLRHPSIIQLFEIFENTECIYLVMEFAKYGEFFDYIVQNTLLQEEEASMFFVQVITAVEFIHSHNIVHRDLKPENLLLVENKTLKIIDFGLSNSYDKPNSLKTPCGSPCYAAPEMLVGKRYSGLEVDIWSSGIILYAMVNGYLPFEDENQTELYRKIIECKLEFEIPLTAPCLDLIRRLLNPNPRKRITLEEIFKHAFYIQGKRLLEARKIVYNEEEIEIKAIKRLKELGIDADCINEAKKKNSYNQISTCYYLTVNRIKYEKYLEHLEKKREESCKSERADYGEEVCGTEEILGKEENLTNEERKEIEEKDNLFFNDDGEDENVILINEENKEDTPDIKKFIFNFEENKDLNCNIKTENPKEKLKEKIGKTVVKTTEKKVKSTKKIISNVLKKNVVPLTIKTTSGSKNFSSNLTPYSKATTTKNANSNTLNFNNYIIQNTNYNININSLSNNTSKTPKHGVFHNHPSSKDKNLSFKPIQINIFNSNSTTPTQKKLNLTGNNFVVLDYNVNLTRPCSKSKKGTNKSGENIIKTKSSNNESTKEIIRLYSSNPSNKKKISNSSQGNLNNFISNTNNNLNDFVKKVKPPSLDKIFPISTKNGESSTLFTSKFNLNNISNNFHKITKNSENLFFKRKTESAYHQSMSPSKKTTGFKFLTNKTNSSTNEKKFSAIIGSSSKKPSFYTNPLFKKANQPIKLSKVDNRKTQNISNFEANLSMQHKETSDKNLSLKEKIFMICLANRIKVKQVK